MSGIAPFNSDRIPTVDQDAALDAANAPSAVNPFATMADVTGTSDSVKVSGADTTAGYLSDKLIATPASITWAIVNGGGDEDLRLTIANATTALPGLIELATQAEVNAGADATRAVTPATLGLATNIVKFGQSAGGHLSGTYPSPTVATVPFSVVATALAAASTDIDVNAQKIVDLADPTAAQDAATKAYVDAVAGAVVKVSAADTTSGYLSDKLTATPASVTWTIINPGGDEDLQLAIAIGTTALPGLVELATQAEVDAGVDTTRAVTSATLAAAATVIKFGQAAGGDLAGTYPNPTVVAATTTAAGKIELATQAEVDTGTDTARAVVPSTFANSSRMGTPVDWGSGSIGATTTTRYLSRGFDPALAPTVRVPWIVNHAGTIDMLTTFHDTAGGSANTVIYTVRKNGVATALTVTIAANSTTPVSDTVNSFTVVQDDVIDIEITKAAGITSSPGNPSATFRYRPS